MKLVITSSGEHLDSQTELRFGRAKVFLYVDTDTNEKKFITNAQNRNAVQGAGIQSGQHVVWLQPDCLITGHCGPKAFRVLSRAGIKVFLADNGSVQDNIDRFLKGQLEETLTADVEGHWV